MKRNETCIVVQRCHNIMPLFILIHSVFFNFCIPCMLIQILITFQIVTLQYALELIHQGQLGIKPAARAFNIPAATLHHAARRRKISSPMQQGGNHVVSCRSKITPSISGQQMWSFVRPAVKFICLWGNNKHSHNCDRKTVRKYWICTVTLILNVWRIYHIYMNLVRTLFGVFWVTKIGCALESMAH